MGHTRLQYSHYPCCPCYIFTYGVIGGVVLRRLYTSFMAHISWHCVFLLTIFTYSLTVQCYPPSVTILYHTYITTHVHPRHQGLMSLSRLPYTSPSLPSNSFPLSSVECRLMTYSTSDLPFYMLLSGVQFRWPLTLACAHHSVTL